MADVPTRCRRGHNRALVARGQLGGASQRAPERGQVPAFAAHLSTRSAADASVPVLRGLRSCREGCRQLRRLELGAGRLDDLRLYPRLDACTPSPAEILGCGGRASVGQRRHRTAPQGAGIDLDSALRPKGSA